MLRKLALVTACLALAPAIGAQQVQVHLDSLTLEEWKADLDSLEAMVPREHLNAFHTVSEEEFHDTVAAVRERLPSLTPAQTVLEFQRVVALLRDGHSGVYWSALGMFDRLGLRLYLFEEGLYVTHASDEQKDSIGKRVVAVGGVPIQRARDFVTPYISRDNEMGVKDDLPAYLTLPALLHHTGLAKSPVSARFTVEDSEGRQSDYVFPALAHEDRLAWAASTPPPSDPLLSEELPEQNFRYTYLRKEKAVYARFNRVMNEPGRTLPREGRNMLKLFDEKDASYLIIDVRQNGGGNNFLARSLIDKLEAHERVNREGNLFLITGRHTFSAAMDFSTGVEQRTKVLIVGEPGGSRPNSYGDAKSHLLPNSNITVRLSTIYWQDSTPDDARMMILPDIEAPPTFAHYTENRDPALEAIFRYRDEMKRR